MEIVTVFSCNAVASSVVDRAFCSSAYVVFVEVIAVVAFFAEAFEPVLAD